MTEEIGPVADEASPDTAAEQGASDETRSFAGMQLEPEIEQALTDMGFVTPMEVQSAVFPHALAGRDIMVQSRTGSGKTAAFGIPIAHKISAESSGAQALILAPTRELAIQVSEELKRITKHKSISVVPIYGGAPMKPQLDALEAGAQIIAGTPGRVLDHIRRKTLKTGDIRFLVLDECDEMLSMGFQEEIENILSYLPKPDERQTMLFSATIPDGIERIARRHMNEPEMLQLSVDGVGVREIDHYYYMVSGLARTRDLLKVLKTEKPESAIIFCNTREDTNTVAKYLTRHGYDAEAISSDLTQKDRERVMKRSRDKNLRFLVATDIAARGIDISDLSHVINYSFPESPEVYVHRTGRTGRAGKKGIALSLVGPREIGAFYYLKLIYKIRPEERDLPTTEELQTLQEGEQYQRVVDMISETPNAQYLSLARRLWQSTEGERVVAALLQRLLTEARQEEQPQQAPSESRSESRTESRGESRSARDDDSSEAEEDGNGRRRRRRRSESARDGGRSRRRREPSRARSSRDDRDSGGASAPAPAARASDSAAEDAEPVAEAEVAAPAAEAEVAAPAAQAESVAPAAEAESAAQVGETESKPSPSRTRSRGGKRSRRPSSTKSKASGESREFWETWADEKSARSDDDDADNGSDGSDTEVTASADDNGSGNGEITTRLYINIGKREEASAEEIRALIGEVLGDDAERIGSIALRNTHAYVRVPEDIADRVIDALSGKSFKDREVVIERARR